MALNVGDFKQRWLNVPEAVRQTFIDDLSRICDILKPETSLEEWQSREQRLQQESERKIEAAYAQRKAELIEEARIRKQLALEKLWPKSVPRNRPIKNSYVLKNSEN